MTTSERMLTNMRNYRAKKTEAQKEEERKKNRERNARKRRLAREADARARARHAARQPAPPPATRQARPARARGPLTTEQQQQARVRRIANALNKAYVPDGSNPWLNDTSRVIEYIMQKYKKTTLKLNGHTDNIGSDSVNIIFGNARCVSIKNYMVSLGVAPHRIQTYSYGEKEPLKGGQSQRVNRRVEMFLVKLED